MRLFSNFMIISLSGVSVIICAQTPKKQRRHIISQAPTIRQFTPNEREFASEIIKLRDRTTSTGELEAALKDQDLIAIGNIKDDPFSRRWPELINKFGLDHLDFSNVKVPLPDCDSIVIGTKSGFRAYRYTFHPSSKIEDLLQQQIDFIENGMKTDFYAKRVLELNGIKSAESFTVTVFVFPGGGREVMTDFILGPCQGCDRYTVASGFIVNMKN